MAETTTTGKNITTVEELTTLSGTEKVFVNSGGTIKQIAPENAKFGGGTVTVFYAGEEATASNLAMEIRAYANLYKDPELTEMATAQEVYDACMAGLVWLAGANYNGDLVHTLCTYIYWCDSSGASTDSTNVVYTEVKESNYTIDFTDIRNGTKPSVPK